MESQDCTQTVATSRHAACGPQLASAGLPAAWNVKEAK